MLTKTKSNNCRLKKRLKGILIAAGLIAGMCSMIAVPASAANNYDANGDGQVSTSDAVYIYRYLMGEMDVTDLSRLDVDGNHIINNEDAECVTRACMGVRMTWHYVYLV